MQALAVKNLIMSEVDQVDDDVMQMLLQDKRSPSTRLGYQRDLNDFFRTMAGQDADQQLVNEFLSLSRAGAVNYVLRYKATMIEKGLAEATINRRLAALRSLVKFARRIGRADFTLEDVEGEPIKAYRDTSGPSTEQVKAMLQLPDREKLKGKRDHAILRLLWDNALRRSEVVKANIKDFDTENCSLAILGKGRGTQQETISLSEKTVEAIEAWLNTRGEKDPAAPLFISLDNKSRGHRLTGEGLAYLVKTYAKEAGVKKKMSPHRMRHSSITAALEATGGNVAKVQKLSRHSKIETLMLYNDARENVQGEVTDLLAGLV